MISDLDDARESAKFWKEASLAADRDLDSLRSELEGARRVNRDVIAAKDAARAEAEKAWRCEKEAAAERDAARAQLEQWKIKWADLDRDERRLAKELAQVKTERDINFRAWKEMEMLKTHSYQRAERLQVIADDSAALETLYARAIDRVGTLEKTLDAVRCESTRQTEEIRALKTRLAPEPPRERPYRTDPFAGVD